MDFMASYGIALIVIIVAVAVLYIISNSNSNIFQQTCTAYSGFSCSSFFLSNNGILNITLSQAIGGEIQVNAASCSSAISSTGSNPEYGNYNVFNSIYYYPTSEFSNSIDVYTGSSSSFLLYCYGPSGVATSQQQGSQFIGYIWLNYTILNTNVKTTQLVAAITVQYT